MSQHCRSSFKLVGRTDQTHTTVLKLGLTRAFPLEQENAFEELLGAIDLAKDYSNSRKWGEARPSVDS